MCQNLNQTLTAAKSVHKIKLLAKHEAAASVQQQQQQ